MVVRERAGHDLRANGGSGARIGAETTPPPTPGVALTRVEPTRSRALAATRTWLGTRTWPAYGAAGITGAYGLLKAYWVFGGTALWSIAPLSPDMIEKARSHTAPRWFVIADAVTVMLAVVGVLFALATVCRRRWLPVGFVRWTLWPLAALMVFRAVSATFGDVYELVTGAATGTTVWDLVLWSPLFLVWGLLWAATALTYARRPSVGSDTEGTARLGSRGDQLQELFADALVAGGARSRRVASAESCSDPGQEGVGDQPIPSQVRAVAASDGGSCASPAKAAGT
jgi:hypothetical protein